MIDMLTFDKTHFCDHLNFFLSNKQNSDNENAIKARECKYMLEYVHSVQIDK